MINTFVRVLVAHLRHNMDATVKVEHQSDYELTVHWMRREFQIFVHERPEEVK